ncbi:peptidoglycan-binding protein [Streptomyces sp. S07_1.15]|uniref:peptidoglycan-binding protein n=1 Tax=Streptomyces sp. S07_1.15 TaxID=2873925 RepID=UPI001D132ED2|nr:peptidoglycan-binding protein [Streptomyces sp. S07_1.15]MCC3652149.1 peptidoglycan-binding protein [Streptomyces sp. S07_1.15]
MSRWKQLPDTLDERTRHLVVQLRRLKDRSGLSLVSLGRKTAYSRSSWERYLNGKALPPRQAVEQLARLGGTDPTRLLVLHELAEAAGPRTAGAPATAGNGAEDGPAEDGPAEDGAAGDSPAAEAPAEDGTARAASPVPRPDPPADPLPGPGPDPARAPEATRRRRLRVPVVAGLAVAAVAAGTALVVAAPWEDGDTPAAPGAAGSSTPAEPSARAHDGPFVYEPGRTYRCDVRRENGLLGAGHSATRDAVLQNSTTGWDVVEAQCLLKHHGFSPGGIDGIYGDLTARAVKRMQDEHGLVVDGKVGPHTWGVLRG